MRISKILGAAAIAAIFALSGCGKKGGSGEKDLEQMKNEVCACKDKKEEAKKCYDDVMAKWAKKNEGKKGDKNAKPSEKMKKLSEEMGKCVTDIMSAAMPAPPAGDPAAPPAGDPAAPPAGDPAAPPAGDPAAPPAGGDQAAPPAGGAAAPPAGGEAPK